MAPFYNEMDSCKFATDEGICGGEFPLDKSYTEICGSLCPKKENECAGFSQKMCRKNKPKCMLDKVNKKCVEAGEVSTEICAKAESKKDCNKIHPGCKWFKRKNTCVVKPRN